MPFVYKRANILIKSVSWGVVLLHLAFVFATPAYALNPTFPSNVPTTVGGFVGLICRVAAWMFTFLIVLSIVFIILAAYNYLTSAGDSEKVRTAHRMIIYTAVAVVVAVIARGVPLIVIGTLLPTTTLTGSQQLTCSTISNF